MALLPTTALVDWTQLLESARPSIFLVEFTPVKAQSDEMKRLAKAARTRLNPLLAQLLAQEWLTETGIAARLVGGQLFILTTAHIVDHLFHAVRCPISAAKLNQLFTIQVVCIHAEQDFRLRGGIGGRAYTPALASGINCAHDLLMLRVSVGELATRTQGIHRVLCTDPHPVLPFSAAPQLGEQCLLFSWPPFRPGTFTVGHEGQMRSLRAMSSTSIGYDVDLLEAAIGSELGSSGGPLFNPSQQVKGTLHGGYDGPVSFIPTHVILAFIDEHAVNPPPEEESSDDEEPVYKRRRLQDGASTSRSGRRYLGNDDDDD